MSPIECHPNNCGCSLNELCLEDPNNTNIEPSEIWKQQSLLFASAVEALRGKQLSEEDYDRELVELLNAFPLCVIIPYEKVSGDKMIEDLASIRGEATKSPWDVL